MTQENLLNMSFLPVFQERGLKSRLKFHLSTNTQFTALSPLKPE